MTLLWRSPCYRDTVLGEWDSEIAIFVKGFGRMEKFELQIGFCRRYLREQRLFDRWESFLASCPFRWSFGEGDMRGGEI
jgi:hypothetical protein